MDLMLDSAQNFDGHDSTLVTVLPAQKISGPDLPSSHQNSSLLRLLMAKTHRRTVTVDHSGLMISWELICLRPLAQLAMPVVYLEVPIPIDRAVFRPLANRLIPVQTEAHHTFTRACLRMGCQSRTLGQTVTHGQRSSASKSLLPLPRRQVRAGGRARRALFVPFQDAAVPSLGTSI